MGVSRRAAAEFSFFLSLPTMGGAVAYDLYKNRDVLSFDDMGLISLGFATAFLSGLLVVRWLVGFVSQHGFGLFQCLALVPGVSRSGSTIVGALLLGVSKRAAAEFSFFLSLPTMGGAVAYDLYKNRDVLDFNDLGLIAIGFGMAFLSGLLVVRWLLGFVARHGFAVFGWWRILVGGLSLALLSLGF